MTAAPAPAALIPHTGRMCLLDRVGAWDAARVRCYSASHRRRDHPLRRGESLAALHLLEYAAQATAVHAGLTRGPGEGSVPLKLLAGAREVTLHVASLDEVVAELQVDAALEQRLGDNLLYSFRVSADGRLLADGRLSVVAP